MTNLTLSLDEEVLKAARRRAVQEGTSVNEICRKALETYARAGSPEDKLLRFDALMARFDAHARSNRSHSALQPESRQQMYERVLGERIPGGAASRRRVPG
jgi:hypothetical protein